MIEGIYQPYLLHNAGGDGIHRLLHRVPCRPVVSGAEALFLIVVRPADGLGRFVVASLRVEGACTGIFHVYAPGKVAQHRGIGYQVVLYRKRVVAYRLYGRAYGADSLCGAVEAVVAGLFADAAGNGENIPAVIHNAEAALNELLAVRRERSVVGFQAGVGVFKQLVHLSLHIEVNVQISRVAPAPELVPRFGVGNTQLIAQVGDYLIDSRVEIPVLRNGVAAVPLVGEGAVLSEYLVPRNVLVVQVALVLAVLADYAVIIIVAHIGVAVVCPLYGSAELYLLGKSRFIFVGADIALIVHTAQSVFLTDLGLSRVIVHVISGGRTDDSRQQSALGYGQVAYLLVEVILRRRADTGGGTAEADTVQVAFKDIILCVFVFQRQRPEYLPELSAYGYIVVLGYRPDKLLGYGGAARRTACESRREGNAESSLPVNAVMLEETLILDRREGVQRVLPDIFDIDPDTALAAADGLQQDLLVIAVHSVDEAGVRKLYVRQVDVKAALRELHDIHSQSHGNDAYCYNKYHYHAQKYRAEKSKHSAHPLIPRHSVGMIVAFYRLLLPAHFRAGLGSVVIIIDLYIFYFFISHFFTCSDISKG